MRVHPYYIFTLQLLMDRDENDSSQQQQGFYKPQLKVIESSESSPPRGLRPQQFASQANDLIIFKRPVDFLPRVLASSPPIYQQLIDLDLAVSNPKQQLSSINRQKIKKSKYLSLQEKYKSIESYRLIYSKIQGKHEFNSYLFSLNHTTDYNPHNYQQIQANLSGAGKFQSRFECGNLMYAYQCLESKIQEYDLILQNDTNTKGYNQWFYFSFRNELATSVRFNIVNLIKKHSLFEEGVRPVGFSLKRSHEGWHSVGRDVDYQKSYVCREITNNPAVLKNYYTLSFTIDFQCENDLVYIALNYPYTYTRMVKFINDIAENFPLMYFLKQSRNCEKTILAYTIANNAVPMIRLKHPEYKIGKKILIMGRQHPGESVGSFVLEGFLKNLLSDEKFFKSFEVIVIPMINPDGVIYGNFRTNLAGFDLNRQWIEPNKWMHPEIYYISKFLSTLDNVIFVIDFHGHSKKYNSFIYACNGENPYAFRVFPYICGQQTELFSLRDCTYSITADKEKTARVKLFRDIKKPQVFTLETSFFGYSDQAYRKFRYQISDLLQIGQKVSESLKIFLIKKKELVQYQKEVKDKEYLFEQWSFQNKQDIDSESNPSEDELTPVQRKEKVISEKPRKKSKGKSKKKKKPSKDDKKANSNYLDGKMRLQAAEQKPELSQKVIKISMADRLLEPVIKKKAQSVRLVNFTEVKINKKIHKALSIIAPPLPKNTAPNIVHVTSMNKNTQSNAELKNKKTKKQYQLPQPKIPPLQEQKIKKEESIPPSPSTFKPSNLLSTTNYYAQIHEKLQKHERASSLHQKTQSLQINNMKKEVFFPKGNTLNVLRKLISNQDDDQPKEIVTETALVRPKHKEKVYFIRQNRVVNSISRIQEDEIKRNLEEQINSRTQALRNCQKKMREMSLGEPILQTNEDAPNLEATSKLFYINSTPKSYKFPTIRMDRKLDYFNF